MWGVVEASRRFNYVARATIVIAKIPLNSIALQGALNFSPRFVGTGAANITIPFANDVDSAFSDSLTANGTFDVTNTTFSGDAYNEFAGDNKGYIVLDSSDTSNATVNYDTN